MKDMSNRAMKTVSIKRTTGERVTVEVDEAQHYEVNLWNDGEGYMRHALVIAPTAAVAKRIAKPLAADGEVVESARKINHATVAVMQLHGATVEAQS
jgi:hypothetical protein